MVKHHMLRSKYVPEASSLPHFVFQAQGCPKWINPDIRSELPRTNGHCRVNEALQMHLERSLVAHVAAPRRSDLTGLFEGIQTWRLFATGTGNSFSAGELQLFSGGIEPIISV